MTRLLELDSIGKRYGPDRALVSASIAVERGRIHALVGRNGSGKTTLLRIAAGLEAADTGFVRYRGRLRARPRLHRLAREGLFFLPAEGLLVRGWTVRTHLGRAGAPDVDALAAEMDLVPLLDRYPRGLSAGERRIAEVAVALARHPRCLLADEPLSGLAPIAAERVVHGLRRLAAEGCAVLVSGQRVRSLLEIADDVTWLEAGSTRRLGPPDRARAAGAFRRRFLRVDDPEGRR